MKLGFLYTTMSRSNQSKRWLITIFDMSASSFKKMSELVDKCDYLVYGLEVCPDTQRDHVHLFCRLKSRKRFQFFKDLWPDCHIDKCDQKDYEISQYCKKDGFYCEFGDPPQQSRAAQREARKRERDDFVLAVAKGQKEVREIPDDLLVDLTAMRLLDFHLKNAVGPRRDDLKVFTITGGTGVGKTHAVYDVFPDVCECIYGNQEWFVNTDAPLLLFDEFCGQISAMNMLRYLDKYPRALPIKGSFRPLTQRVIVILSNTVPQLWYRSKEAPSNPLALPESTIPEERRRALYRRISYGDFHDRRFYYHATGVDVAADRAAIRAMLTSP